MDISDQQVERTIGRLISIDRLLDQDIKSELYRRRAQVIAELSDAGVSVTRQPEGYRWNRIDG